MKRALQLAQHVAESSKTVENELSAKVPRMKDSVVNLMSEFMDDEELCNVIL